MHDLMVLPVTVFSQVYCLFSPPEHRRPARSVNTLAGVLRVKTQFFILEALGQTAFWRRHSRRWQFGIRDAGLLPFEHAFQIV